MPTRTPLVSSQNSELSSPQPNSSRLNIEGKEDITLIQTIRDDIISCSFAPGQRLRTEDLKARYQLGIGTIREALSHLVSEGFVKSSAGRGYTVAPISKADLQDITRLRLYFEVSAIRDSIERGGEYWEAEILTAYHLLMSTEKSVITSPDDNWTTWSDRHKRFHDSLVAACTSPWLLNFRNILFDQAQRYRKLSMAYQYNQRNKQDEHKRIMNAVLARNIVQATSLVTAHIERSAENALRSLEAARPC